MTRKPVILLTPGAWLPASTWSKVSSRLQAAGYEAIPIALPSTGPLAESSWQVDAATVLEAAAPFFAEDRPVFFAAHSYSGAVAIAAARGNSIAERAARGLQGGICGILFLASMVVISRGKSVRDLTQGQVADYARPSAPGEKPYVLRFDPEGARQHLFNDLSVEEGTKYAAVLQPASQRTMEDAFEVSALEISVPMTYLVCENDMSVPVAGQKSLIARVPGMKSVRCNAGHCPQLSRPDFVTKVIINASEEALSMNQG